MDLDIDTVNLLGSEFDNTGKYVMWSPLADITTKENLAISLELPFPTGKESTLKVVNSLDSFFTTYDDYIRDLFELETETVLLGKVPRTHKVVNKEGFFTLKLKLMNPERLKLLVLFLENVNQTGFTIKGRTDSEGNWKQNEAVVKEWENVRVLDAEQGITLQTPNALKELGFKTVDAAKNAIEQIQAIVNLHNLYIRNADNETREQMAKNHCVNEMFHICSDTSNLIELMTGVDSATKVIKDPKTGAVALSPYNGQDSLAAPGNYFTLHTSFQTGQVGKDCVGIGAVSIKVNSNTQYYADMILLHGTSEEKMRLIPPKVNEWGIPSAHGNRYYLIGGKPRYGLSNLYDKRAENALETVEFTRKDGITVTLNKDNPEEIINLLAEDLIPYDLPSNVAVNLAAMLSVAVDGRFS